MTNFKKDIKEQQCNYWNGVAKDKEFTTPLDFELLSKLTTKESNFLDYGCGYGRTLNELYLQGYKNLVGFDFAKEMICRGKAKYPYLDLRVSQNNCLDCESESVDMVLLFAVLTCIIRDKEQRGLIRELKRVLKPNSYIYINDFLINSDDRNIIRYKNNESKYNKYGVFEIDGGAVLRHHYKDWIFELMNEFEVVEYREHTFKTMNGNISNGFVYVGKKS